MSDAEKRMREIYAQELDRDGEGMAAFLWRESGPAHPDSSNGRIIRAMLAAEAAALEKAAQVADENAATSVPLMNGIGVGAMVETGRHCAATEIATAIRSLKEGAIHVG